MKTEVLRHIEILKTVPEIKESIEELRFGCRFIWNHNEWVNIIYFVQEHNIVDLDGDVYHFEPCTTWDRFVIKDIIWQIHGWHLGMFLHEKYKNIDTEEEWDYFLTVVDWFIHKETIVDYEENSQKTICILDITKPYMEQSEEFFKKLNDWLIKEFNIKL